LAELYSGAQKERLVGTHKALDLIFQRLRDMNRLNEKLTKSAKKILENTIKTINSGGVSNPTYGKQGTLDAGTTPGKFVSKEF